MDKLVKQKKIRIREVEDNNIYIRSCRILDL